LIKILLNFEGIDDDEIDSYILTDTEASIKSKYWMARNSEHLQLMAEKYVFNLNEFSEIFVTKFFGSFDADFKFPKFIRNAIPCRVKKYFCFKISTKNLF